MEITKFHSAVQFRNLANAFNTETDTSQYNSVLTAIHTAASKGEYSMHYYVSLSNHTVERLRQQGFSVKYDGAMNESWHTISW